MDFSYSETQQLLHDSVGKFVSDNGGAEQHRLLAGSQKSFDDSLWQQFAALGWLAAPFSEQLGGLEAGSADMMVITEALGKGLLNEPFLSTLVCCGGFLRHGANEQQSAEFIPSIIDGSRQWAFAYAEVGSGFSMSTIGVTANKTESGYSLSGEKIAVLNGDAADYLIVSARTSGATSDVDGISLFIVDADAPGLTRTGYTTVDGHRAADISLQNTVIDAARMLGSSGAAWPLIESVVNESIVAMAAEAVGAMQMLLDATVEYTKTREQFGQAIGKFQVLQHRMVDMYLRLEETRSLLFDAAFQLDTNSNEAGRACAALKVKLAEAGRFVSQQAVQLHGGIGMTDELAVSHYFKRLQVLGMLFGDEDFYLEKYAAMTA